jgi:hypothetical protein
MADTLLSLRTLPQAFRCHVPTVPPPSDQNNMIKTVWFNAGISSYLSVCCDFNCRLCCMGKLNAQSETACGETAKQQLNQSIC